MAALVLLLLVGNTQGTLITPASGHREVIPLVSRWRPVQTGKGGRGGGGDRSPTPATKGRLPRSAPQFMPPVVAARNPAPKLVIEPTLPVTSEIHIPNLPITICDPNGVTGPPSNGPGSGGGIGDGTGTGIGNNRGSSYGDSDGRGTGRSGGSVTRPVLVYKIDPDYSDQARNARLQGMVMVRLDISTDGVPQNLRIDQGLGMGLDEKAMEAVRKWKFRPGTRNGKPIIMSALVEVHFRLL